MTSQWARWRLKSPASWLFTQPFIQGADRRKHQSSPSLPCMTGIHRSPVNSPHKLPITWIMFPLDDVIINSACVHAVHENTQSYNQILHLTHCYKNRYLVIYVLIIVLAPKHTKRCPDSKVHGANMGPVWGRQDPGGPHVGPLNFIIWVIFTADVDYIAMSFWPPEQRVRIGRVFVCV